jgi:hypothetical protein
MFFFSNLFENKAVRMNRSGAGNASGAQKKAEGLLNAGSAQKKTERRRNVYAELEKAANAYAAQLERATRELGYNLKDYEGITN